MSHGWPSLPLDEWKDTYATLHMWTQIVGKIRLQNTPPTNHYWNCVLYVTARGLTTTPFRAGSKTLDLEFDFIDHKLIVRCNDGGVKTVSLYPRTVADFYQQLRAVLKEFGMEVTIREKPDEVPDPIPFSKDTVHASYDAEYANRFWRILVNVDHVMKEFRARFIGKCSPVHFFWGSFDLAVSRFSGRRAPERPGADAITRRAYSHEVSSAGFWPGGGAILEPAFYSYTVPTPQGFGEYRVTPGKAFYSAEMGEYFLKYEDVRSSDSPEAVLLDFFQSTYEAGANLAKWDRAELEVTGPNV